MKRSILVILLLFIDTCLFAQYDNANLLVQSADGKTVKLLWFLKSWNKDITGFDIKRKEGLQNWVKLNNSPIIPEISNRKSLLVVESDKIEESRIRAKLYRLIQTKKIKEISDTAFLLQLNNDNNAIRDISNVVSHDFDVALASGFAYVDHTALKKTRYEYGLFASGTDIMLDSVLWNYGQIPDLNAVTEITSKGTTTQNGVQLIWNADINKMKAADIAGFNIYREGIRLNSSPIAASNNKDISEFTWYDKSANSATQNQYSISGESLFGIEGIIKPYIYNPADHPDEYKQAEVTDIASLGYYFKEGISVKWTFPKEFERFIKGFYVEKDNIPKGYKQVSSLLDPSARSFTDQTESSITGYLRFKVSTIYNDKTPVAGTEKLYNYFPIREPPQPQNVSARGVRDDKKISINMNWDPIMRGDSVTRYYKVYMSSAEANKFYPVTDKPIKTNKYTYTFSQAEASLYKFFVTSISRTDTESPSSDTVTVMVPGAVPPVHNN